MRVIGTFFKAAQAAAIKGALEAVEQEVERLVKVEAQPDDQFEQDVSGAAWGPPTPGGQWAPPSPEQAWQGHFVQDVQFFTQSPKLVGTRGERVYAAALLGAQHELKLAAQKIGSSMSMRPVSTLQQIVMVITAAIDGRARKKPKGLIHWPSGTEDPDYDPRGGILS